eukprot:SAG22_NODE_74_length_22289_cov_65.265119_21_plen_187_part_00
MFPLSGRAVAPQGTAQRITRGRQAVGKPGTSVGKQARDKCRQASCARLTVGNSLDIKAVEAQQKDSALLLTVGKREPFLTSRSICKAARQAPRKGTVFENRKAVEAQQKDSALNLVLTCCRTAGSGTVFSQSELLQQQQSTRESRPRFLCSRHISPQPREAALMASLACSAASLPGRAEPHGKAVA